MEGSITVHTLATFDTQLSADSVEWCPAEPFRDVLACGAYELNENKSDATQRIGRIYLLRVVNDGKLELLQVLRTPAVLDMKWLQVVDVEVRILLAIADSDGYLRIYQLNSEESKPKLTFVTQVKVSEDNESVMAVSLDWSTEKYSTSSPICSPRIVVSDSEGQISQFTWSDSGDLTRDFTWPVHKFQAWAVAFDYCNATVFYTGGDDSMFLGFDTRIGSNPTFRNQEHTTGVTSIHSNVDSSNVLATGCYDEILRLWDKRNLAQPESTINVGGGIWRLKWDPFTRRYLLAACMDNGFKIVQNEIIPCIVADYKEHKGAAYGCDWSFLKQSDLLGLSISGGDTLISTCSFKDFALKISAVDFWPDKDDDGERDEEYVKNIYTRFQEWLTSRQNTILEKWHAARI